MNVKTTQAEVIVRHKGTTHGYKNVCPHLGKPLYPAGQSFTIEAGYLICQYHAAVFDAETGHCISGPCEGSSLTPVEPE